MLRSTAALVATAHLQGVLDLRHRNRANAITRDGEVSEYLGEVDIWNEVVSHKGSCILGAKLFL